MLKNAHAGRIHTRQNPNMGPATTTFVKWLVFVITCVVCLTSFAVAIALAVFYLCSGRPVGAPYAFRTLSSTVPVIIRDEESQQEAFRSEFANEIKCS